MAIAVVQHVLGAIGTGTPSTAFSTSFGLAVTSGNAVIGAFVCSDGSNHFTNITDNKGNSYPVTDLISSSSSASSKFRTFSAFNITNGPITITANSSSPGVTFGQFVLAEISGAGAVQAHTIRDQTGLGTGANAILANVTTPVPCFVWGATMSATGVGTTAAGTGFTLLDADAGAADWALAHEWIQQGAAGPTSVTFTNGSATNSNFDTGVLAIGLPGAISFVMEPPFTGVGVGVWI